jgi:phage shock protein A
VPIEDAPLPGGPAPDYDEHGTPSLDYVRDKIEGRHATALGWQELTGDTEAARTADEKFEERERKGKDRLAEIRKSLGL